MQNIQTIIRMLGLGLGSLLLCTVLWAANFCPQCGEKVPPDAKFCPECGAKLAGPATETKNETKEDLSPSSSATQTPSDLRSLLQGKRYLFAISGTINGEEVGTGDQAVAAERLRTLFEKELRSILSASVYDATVLESLRANAEAMAVLEGGSAEEVRNLLKDHATDFLVRILYRTNPLAKVGPLHACTAVVTAEILSLTTATAPVRISSPLMGTPRHPPKTALGAFEAAMEALNYAANETLTALRRKLGSEATAETTVSSSALPDVTPLSKEETRSSLRARQPRVGVFSFENRAGIDAQVDMGDGMADMLITELMNSGRVKVLERTALEGVLREKNLQAASGSRIANTALSGVDYLIKGTVTEYSYKQQSSGGGIGFKGVKLGGSKTEAHVALDMRLIDPASGEILASKRAEKRNVAKGISAGASVAGVSFGGEHWAKTPIGETTRACIVDAANQLLSAIEGQPWRSVVVGTIPGGVSIRGGTDQGLRPGMCFTIVRMGEAAIDPETGESLGSSKTTIGRIIVVKVDEKISSAKVLEGGMPERGDLVLLEE